MRKNVFGRKLKRTKNQRQALFKGLMSSLVMYGKIKTTEAKAKSIKGEVDKLVTRARKEGALARKLLEPHLTATAIEKFISEVVPSFKGRNSGFTKTARLGHRVKDNSSMIFMTWTDEVVAVEKEKIKKAPVKKTVSVKEEKKTVNKPKAEAVKKPTKRSAK